MSHVYHELELITMNAVTTLEWFVFFVIGPSFEVSGFSVQGLRGRHFWPSQKWVLLCNFGDGELAVLWRVMNVWKNKRWKLEIVLVTWLTDESCLRSGADQLLSDQCSRSHWSWSCGNGWWNFCGIFFLCLGYQLELCTLSLLAEY